MDLTYLESADSIRVDYDTLQRDPAARVDADFAELQLFLEMVSTLAVGRTVVVPQTFALDSHIFHRAAKRVWDAYAAAGGNGPAPIRLHLFGSDVTSFEDAISSMLAHAARNGEFHSSSFPELNSRSWRIGEGRGGAELLRQLDDHDPRKAPLEATVAAFRHTGRNAARRPPTRATLGTMLDRVIAGPTLSGDDTLRRKLDAARSTLDLNAAFDRRSLLRSSAPWPGGDGRQSARDLVGDEALALVVETIDTLYNLKVARTTGARFQHYTTGLGQVGTLLGDTGRAQIAALDVRGEVSGGGDSGTAFDVEVHSSGPLAIADLRAFLAAAIDRPETTTGLTALFRARADHDGEFARSLAPLAAEPDPGARQELMDSHVRVVAGILGNGYRTTSSELPWQGVGLGMVMTGATVGGVMATQSTSTMGVVVSTAVQIGGTALPLAPQLKRRREHRRAERSARRALGTTLGQG